MDNSLFLNEEEDEQRDKYLIFNLGTESYGIEIKYVIEIIGMQAVTAILDVPQFIKGIINLRGAIIPVIDVRVRFNKEELAYSDRTCIIVIQIEQIQIGLIVDKVAEVLVLPSEQIIPPPQLTKQTNQYVKGLGKSEQDVKLILDCEKILNTHELQALI